MGRYLKDFSERFCENCMVQTRNAYACETTVTRSDNLDGVIHGNNIQQEVHVPFPAHVGADDQLWLTVQTWDGQIYHAAWKLLPQK
jgi:hypothetical protein